MLHLRSYTVYDDNRAEFALKLFIEDEESDSDSEEEDPDSALDLGTLREISILRALRCDNSHPNVVDVKMWLDVESRTRPSGAVVNIPVFRLHSVGFDTNVSLPPGLGTVSADSLGIDIEVAGELRPAPNGRGLKGRIGFVTRGNLTPPIKILPEGVLRAAGLTVCRTVKDFAVRSFVDGATAKYKSFRRSEEESSLR